MQQNEKFDEGWRAKQGFDVFKKLSSTDYYR